MFTSIPFAGPPLSPGYQRLILLFILALFFLLLLLVLLLVRVFFAATRHCSKHQTKDS